MATTKSVGFAVESPPIAAAPFGVVNRLTLQDDSTRWEGGVGFESLACAAKVELWDICDPGSQVIFDGTGKPRGVYGSPFGITARDTCTSTMSGSAFHEYAEGRANTLLEAATPKAVEWELKWGWEAATATPSPGRWLTSPDTVVVDATGVAPKTAMMILEDAYAGCSYGGGGMLHMTPGAAVAIPDKEVVDKVLFNSIGTPIIAGAGYAPTGTEVAPWDGNWMFITGPTFVWLGESQVFPEDLSVHIATNDIFFKAERLAAVTFDGCCVFAVKVDLTKCC